MARHLARKNQPCWLVQAIWYDCNGRPCNVIQTGELAPTAHKAVNRFRGRCWSGGPAAVFVEYAARKLNARERASIMRPIRQLRGRPEDRWPSSDGLAHVCC